MANMLALIGFLKNYGIIDIILVDGVEFEEKLSRQERERFQCNFQKGKVLPTENSLFIN